MWSLVPSQDRSVPFPAPSISRTRRSPQDQSRLGPLVRSIPPDSRRRSTSASTTRPVQHNVPSQLSIIARPHEAGLNRSWRADSLCLCLARSRNYPMLQKSKVAGSRIFRENTKQEAIADSYSRNRVIEVACQFNV